jgi:hypothetical protein
MSLEEATALSTYLVANVIPPREVIAVLQDAGVDFVLVGAYGLTGWIKKPRATKDVDVVVTARHQKKALKALLAAFPNLEADDKGVVVRLRDRETREVQIDIMKPNQQLFRAAFKHTQVVHSEGQSYKIPTLEMAIAMKFAPMVSPHRLDADKYLDAHDFLYMVRSNPDIDEKKLAELGDLVYAGGGAEVIKLVDDARAGRKLNL